MFVQESIDGIFELGIRFNAIDMVDTRDIKTMDLISWSGAKF
jgi:hypothetical protein